MSRSTQNFGLRQLAGGPCAAPHGPYRQQKPTLTPFEPECGQRLLARGSRHSLEMDSFGRENAGKANRIYRQRRKRRNPKPKTGGESGKQSTLPTFSSQHGEALANWHKRPGRPLCFILPAHPIPLIGRDEGAWRYATTSAFETLLIVLRMRETIW